MSRVGEPMQAECKGTSAALQCAEIKAFGIHHALHDVFRHDETVPE
jgi:hypothetical protein